MDQLLQSYTKSSINFANETNVTTESSPQYNSDKNSTKQPWPTLFGFIVVVAFTLPVNIRVLCLAKRCRRLHRQMRNVSTLISHLSALTFFAVVLAVVEFLKMFSVIQIESEWSRSIFKFSKNVIRAVYPLNVVGILYEQTCEFMLTRSQLSDIKLYLMWAAALVLGLLSVVAYEVGLHDSKPVVTNAGSTLPDLLVEEPLTIFIDSQQLST